MSRRRLAILGAALLAAGCGQPERESGNAAVSPTPATPGNAVAAAEPAPAPAAPAPNLRAWLIGDWSYDKECASEFAVHFMADGKLSDAGEIGSWAIVGDQVTTTITERIEMGEDEGKAVSPPEVTRYRVERVDQRHGVIHVDDRTVPILRC